MIGSTAFVTIVWTAMAPALLARDQSAGGALDDAPSRYAKFDGFRVHYKSLGKGNTALVFVHGFTCNLTFWRHQVAAFDGKIRMLFIDLPGHGESDKPKIDYTIDLFARAVDAVLTDAKVEQAVLVGHSMGTPVVRQFYRLYPKKTLALVAVDGALRPPPTRPADVEKRVSRFSGPDYRDNLGKFVDTMFLPGTPASVRDPIKRAMQRTPSHVASSTMRGLLDPAIWKEDKIDVPVQAIMAKMPWWNADYEAYVRKLGPRVEYQVIPGASHFLMQDKPQEFNKTLLRFLENQSLVKS